jgi:hypothetical protein
MTTTSATDSSTIATAQDPTGARTRALTCALVWAVLFTAMHGYWFLGGRFGLGSGPNPLPGLPTSLGGWIAAIVINAMFPIGLATPVILIKDRVRGGRRHLLVLLLWAGCVLLVLRGVSGLVDDLVRDVSLSGGGLTGLTDQDIFGTAHPSMHELLSTAALDGYFALGGVLYGWAARACSTAPQSTGR